MTVWTMKLCEDSKSNAKNHANRLRHTLTKRNDTSPTQRRKLCIKGRQRMLILVTAKFWRMKKQYLREPNNKVEEIEIKMKPMICVEHETDQNQHPVIR